MDINSLLSKAKSLLESGKFSDAIAIYKEVLEKQGPGSREAAYSLGIIYQSGIGVAENVDDSIRYYLESENLGNSMATYQLGGIYNRLGQESKAYDAYRSVADENPSAAYWAYVMLKRNDRLDRDPAALVRYLDLAVAQGHIQARKAKAIRLIRGKEGFQKILTGIGMYCKLPFALKKAMNNNEKLKYT